MARKAVPAEIRRSVLIEAGYRCAVPTCRNILAVDLHHIIPVREDGGNEPGNLIALCPTCHALYERGNINQDAILAWKGTLVALSAAFDRQAIDRLLFLDQAREPKLVVSGDGVLRFASLIAAGLARFSMQIFKPMEGVYLYRVRLTEKGARLVEAWRRGDRLGVERALGEDGTGNSANAWESAVT